MTIIKNICINENQASSSMHLITTNKIPVLEELSFELMIKIMSYCSDVQTISRFAQTNHQHQKILQSEKLRVKNKPPHDSYTKILSVFNANDDYLVKRNHIKKEISVLKNATSPLYFKVLVSTALALGVGIPSSIVLYPQISGCTLVAGPAITAGTCFFSFCGLNAKDKYLDKTVSKLESEQSQLNGPQPFMMRAT